MGVDSAEAWATADRAVAEAIAALRLARSRPVLVGLAGAQGSGKSTMAERLASLLSAGGLGTTLLALDDFYLTRAERAELAIGVHPLLATRGVPGTHDIGLLIRTVRALGTERGTVAVPRFDKLADDRAPPGQWGEAATPCDVILLEGWCIGATAQPEEALAAPANELERREDRDGRWRRWVNRQLHVNYAPLFGALDFRIFLRAPDFAVVRRWRGEQEAAMVARTGRTGMSEAQLDRFIAHYERLTRWMIEDRPADLVIELDPVRTPLRIERT